MYNLRIHSFSYSTDYMYIWYETQGMERILRILQLEVLNSQALNGMCMNLKTHNFIFRFMH